MNLIKSRLGKLLIWSMKWTLMATLACYAVVLLVDIILNFNQIAVSSMSDLNGGILGLFIVLSVRIGYGIMFFPMFVLPYIGWILILWVGVLIVGCFMLK